MNAELEKLSKAIQKFIQKAPEFEGDGALAAACDVAMADVQSIISSYEQEILELRNNSQQRM
jgi:hypothetical protein